MIPQVMPNYNRNDLAFERGEGAWLMTADGRRYLDFCSGIAVTALGHGHPHLNKALKAQIDQLWHVSNLFRSPQQEKVARRLIERCFADTAYFCNSGAEANECAIKMIRKYHHAHGNPEKYRLITVAGAFHGRTLATLAATGQAKYLEGFGPRADGFDQTPFGDLEALRAAITPQTAGILFEPVQGEGGVRVADARYLQGLRAIADECGLLLAFDEIQCGMGRTGRLFAHEWAGATPDIMTLAKGLGGGFPVGACLATEAAAIGMTPGSHGSTFGGNPLAMAATDAVLDVMLADGFLPQVQRISQFLCEGGGNLAGLDALPQRYPHIFSQRRGIGLLLGLQCVVPNGAMTAALREAGLVVVPAGDNVIRLLPPLTLTQEDAAIALDRLNQVAAVWRS